MVAQPALRAGEPAKELSIGDRVVQKYRTFTLRTGEQGIERKVPFVIWRVEKVDGARVWVRAEGFGVSGWAPADQVIATEQAMTYYTEQIRDHPNDAFPRVMRAQLWPEDKDTEKALIDCDEAIRIAPQYGAAFERRARLWLDEKQFDKAVRDCETALKLDSDSALAYILRGCAFGYKHEFDKAIADFSDAIRLEPSSDYPLVSRGNILTEKKEIEKALKDFNQAIHVNPLGSDAYTYRAKAWRAQGECDMHDGDSAQSRRLVSSGPPWPGLACERRFRTRPQ
jgi:tetratricopeptide (TPR) repeat protein